MSRRWVGNARERKFSYSRTRQWRRDHAPYDCCKGKHVAVTGACSGIGLELAREAIHRDAKAVSLIDVIDAGRIIRELEDEAADGLSAIFLCKVAAYKADVSKYEEVRCRHRHETCSTMQACCNNMAKSASGPQADCAEAYWFNAQIKQATAECQAAHGPIDVICANAGVGPCGEGSVT